ncbi:helix-turn-helix domain-containing protein [Actinoplanes sp. NPDC051513]|uniref:helix-turn-helix domain-containing protein n=1 Tax=Actinoplanes sp. NPDC051513 TaxID=3363908 RepID=UPI00378D73F0
MTDSPHLADGFDEPVGTALARWRRSKQISGQVLGERVGISQATISRLENNASNPDPQVVRRVAEALELPSEEVERLVGLVERPSEVLIDWQSTQPGLADRQHFVRRLEASARDTRIFQSAVVPGLLQTSEYARAVLGVLRMEMADDQIADSTLAVSEAVAARMQRALTLDEPGRQFHFLIAEDVLGHQVCPPVDMIAQIARLRVVAAYPNVTIRIIPQNAPWPIPPVHGFVLTDDRNVFVDLFSTSLLSRGRRTAGYYRRVFEGLDSAATSDIDPILDDFEKRYIRRLSEATA